MCGAALQDASADPLVGKLIGGSFVVRELIGVGGMGRVYRGEQNTLGRTVAIKVIHPHLAGDDQTVQRFYTEARAASRLNHPNSVSVIDFGRSDDGVLYLVMEYLDGRDLAALMVEQGPIAIDRVVDLVAQTLDALAEAHELGIVHRDLKPENVLVLRSRSGAERVKVLDFGLATVVDSGVNVTRTGLVCGTPAYMSPEQARGEVVDARSDLYSVGAMLFELLTDRPPFEADSAVKLLMMHVNEPPPDPRVVAPQRDIPPMLAGVVMQALAKEPAQRFQSAEEMRRALLDSRRSSATAARPDRPRLCVSCGATNDPSMRYCGSCGARLPGFTTHPGARRSIAPAVSSSTFAFVGRESAMALVDRLRERARSTVLVAEVQGESGVGRTRLLEETGARLGARGDHVCLVLPHPSGVPVTYSVARELARELLGAPADASLAGLELARSVGPIVRAGLEEMDLPSGLRGIEGASRAPAVGVALSWAARQAISRAGRRGLVLLFDDFDHADAPSQDAIGRALADLDEESVLVIGVGTSPPPPPGSSVESIPLEPLTEDEARTLLGDITPYTPNPSFRIVPRALAQLHALAEPLGDTTHARVPNAADLAISRIDRLDRKARRMLQALAVVGTRAPIDLLKAMVHSQDLEPLSELQTRQFVVVDKGEIRFAEDFMADLVEAATPAEARRQLHEAAFDLRADRGDPIEVVANHAALAADGMRSLVVLERAGDTVMRRGDVKAAVRIFRHGAELARKEALASGDSMFDTARASFGRKLGEAMLLVGETMTAEGLLREILDMTELDRTGRARIQLALARVARARGRTGEATRQLVACLELVSGGNPELEAMVQLEIGDLRAAAGNWDSASNAWRRALDILTPRDGDRAYVARTFARLVEASAHAADLVGMRNCLAGAEREALRADAPAIAARAYAHSTTLAPEGFDLVAARQRAIEFAAQAGDAETFREMAIAD